MAFPVGVAYVHLQVCSFKPTPCGAELAHEFEMLLSSFPTSWDGAQLGKWSKPAKHCNTFCWN